MARERRVKKAGVAAGLALSLLTGLAGLCLVLLEDPALRAKESSALSLTLLMEARNPDLSADERLDLFTKARALKLQAVLQTPYNPKLWIDLGRISLALNTPEGQEEYRKSLVIATTIDPRLKPLLERGGL